MDDVEKIIEEQTKKLPPELQEAIASSSLKTKMEDVLIGQPLQQEQIDAFKTEVLLVLLRLEGIDIFAKNLKEQLNISQKRAEDMSRLTNQIIFSDIERKSQDNLKRTETDETRNSDGIRPQSTPTPPPSLKKTDVMQQEREELIETQKPKEEIPIIREPVAIKNEMPPKKPSFKNKLFNDIISRNGAPQTPPTERETPEPPVVEPRDVPQNSSFKKPDMEIPKPPMKQMLEVSKDSEVNTAPIPQGPDATTLEPREMERKLNISEAPSNTETSEPAQETKRETPAKVDVYREPIE